MADAQNPRINEQLEQLDTTLQAIDTTVLDIKELVDDMADKLPKGVE